MRLSPFDDDMACEGDDPEIESLTKHCELGYTPETRFDLTAALALGVANKQSDNAP